MHNAPHKHAVKYQRSAFVKLKFPCKEWTCLSVCLGFKLFLGLKSWANGHIHTKFNDISKKNRDRRDVKRLSFKVLNCSAITLSTLSLALESKWNWNHVTVGGHLVIVQGIYTISIHKGKNMNSSIFDGRRSINKSKFPLDLYLFSSNITIE